MEGLILNVCDTLKGLDKNKFDREVAKIAIRLSPGSNVV